MAGMIQLKTSGSFKNTESFLNRITNNDPISILHEYGRQGVNALSNATPIDTGLTAESWMYEIKETASGYSLIFSNTHEIEGRPIAILIQYGHGTRNGGYVEGLDYINPVIKPLFEQISNDVWKAVTKK